MRTILASVSPRRREFLESLGLHFETASPQIDESRAEAEPPQHYVERLAKQKAQACAQPDAICIAADTAVVVEGEVLGKPRDRADTLRMLKLLSGSWHEVITAVCVGDKVRTVRTRVKMAVLSEAQLSWLVNSGEGDDKAGAYALQGLAGAFIERVEGSVSSVVGLPLWETLQLLAEAGAVLPWG
jgi:septum formation protein